VATNCVSAHRIYIALEPSLDGKEPTAFKAVVLSFYTERDIVRVLFSRSKVVEVVGQSTNRYIIMKERDLKTLNTFRPEQIVFTRSIGSTTWYVVAFRSEAVK